MTLGLLVADFDGCVVPAGTDHIDPSVAETMRTLARTYPLVVVTARASPKARAGAADALRDAGLGAFALRCRDWSQHDSSAEQITAAKVAAIEDVVLGSGMAPSVGVGDDWTDVAAYACFPMRIFHFRHGVPARTGAVPPRYQSIDVHGADLGRAWSELSRRLVS
jgi:hypothetical protein